MKWVGWLVDLLFGWFVARLICRFVDLFVCWLAGWPVDSMLSGILIEIVRMI